MLTLQHPEAYARVVAQVFLTGKLEVGGQEIEVLSNTALNAPEDPKRPSDANVFIRASELLIANQERSSTLVVDSLTGTERELTKEGIITDFAGTGIHAEKWLLEQYSAQRYELSDPKTIGSSTELSEVLQQHQGETLLVAVSQGKRRHIMVAKVNEAGGYLLMEPQLGGKEGKRSFDSEMMYRHLGRDNGAFDMRLVFPESSK